MGLFDTMIGAVGGQQQNAITNLVTGLLTDPNGGGLNGLLDQFKSGGLGHLVESWVGNGQNLPVSAEQIQSVLGADQVRQMAAQVGIAPEALSGHLADLLPQLIDKATPGGSVPDAASLQQGLGGVLQGLLGGH
jgi:uncharacterized protein YidB (DUF937 family)